MAEAVAAIAWGVTIISVTTMAFVWWETQGKFLVPPAAGFVVAGPIFHLLAPIDPIAAAGVGIGVGGLIFALLQAHFGSTNQEQIGALELQSGYQLPAIFLGAGIFGGLGNQLGKGAGAALGGLLGAWLGYKYMWNAFVQFAQSLGYAGPACPSDQNMSQPGFPGCTRLCKVPTKTEAYLELPAACSDPKAPDRIKNWCTKMVEWMRVCPDAAKPPYPGDYKAMQQWGDLPPKTKNCGVYGTYEYYDHTARFADVCFPLPEPGDRYSPQEFIYDGASNTCWGLNITKNNRTEEWPARTEFHPYIVRLGYTDELVTDPNGKTYVTGCLPGWADSAGIHTLDKADWQPIAQFRDKFCKSKDALARGGFKVARVVPNDLDYATSFSCATHPGEYYDPARSSPWPKGNLMVPQ